MEAVVIGVCVLETPSGSMAAVKVYRPQERQNSWLLHFPSTNTYILYMFMDITIHGIWGGSPRLNLHTSDFRVSWSNTLTGACVMMTSAKSSTAV